MRRFLRPVKVGWRNVRGFAGEHELALGPGLYRVSGSNLDTRGDSGSGKTSVLLVISHLLGFCPYSGKDLATWEEYSDGKPMETWGEFDTHEGKLVLRRGEEGFSFCLGTETVRGREADRRLDELCGANAKLRKAMCYRRQKRPGAFFAMANREKVQFLVEVLRIGRLEKEAKDSLKRLPVLEAAANAAAASAKSAREDEARRASEVPPDPPPLPDVSEERRKMREAWSQASLDARFAEAALAKAREEAEGEARAAALPFAEAAKDFKIKAEAAYLERPPVDREAALDAANRALQCWKRLVPLEKENRERERDHAFDRTAKSAEAAEIFAEVRHREGTIAARLRQLGEQLPFLRRAECPTCERPGWEGAPGDLGAAEAEAAALEAELRSLPAREAEAHRLELLSKVEFVPDPFLEPMRALYRRLEAAEAAEKAKEATAVRAQEADALARRSRLLAEAAGAAEKAAAARSEATARSAEKIAALSREADRLKGEAAAAERAHAEGVRQDRERSEARRRAFVEKENRESALKEARERREFAEKEEAGASAKLAAERDYLELVRGFLARIFGEVLQEVADAANDGLAALPNSRKMSVRFAESRETESGARDEIAPLVSFGGTERPFDSAPSGGQETSLELSLDLAVRRVVSRRAGFDLELLMLDEALPGMDAVTKRECLELLKGIAEAGACVLVVEHAQEFQELFDREVRVVHEDGKSSLAAGSL